MSLHLGFVGVSDLAFCSTTIQDNRLMRHLQEIVTWRRGARLPTWQSVCCGGRSCCSMSGGGEKREGEAGGKEGNGKRSLKEFNCAFHVFLIVIFLADV